jgi:hypothetical protein
MHKYTKNVFLFGGNYFLVDPVGNSGLVKPYNDAIVMKKMCSLRKQHCPRPVRAIRENLGNIQFVLPVHEVVVAQKCEGPDDFENPRSKTKFDTSLFGYTVTVGIYLVCQMEWQMLLMSSM